MTTIIAAVIGLAGIAMGAFFNKWLMRKPMPYWISCEDYFHAKVQLGEPLCDWEGSLWRKKDGELLSLDVGIGVPNTKIIYHNTEVKSLEVFQYKFRNLGDRKIQNGNIEIALGESAQILGYQFKTEIDQIDLNDHEQESKYLIALEEPETKVIKDGIIHIEFSESINLPSYHTSRKVGILNIYSSGEIKGPLLGGEGAFNDETSWGLKFETWRETRQRIQRRVQYLSRTALSIWIILLVVLIFLLPGNIWSINVYNFLAFLSKPFSIVFFSFTFLLLVYAIILAIRGWFLNIKIPFLKRYLIIYLEKVERLKKAD
jgi:hypothetical protein